MGKMYRAAGVVRSVYSVAVSGSRERRHLVSTSHGCLARLCSAHELLSVAARAGDRVEAVLAEPGCEAAVSEARGGAAALAALRGGGGAHEREVAVFSLIRLFKDAGLHAK